MGSVNELSDLIEGQDLCSRSPQFHRIQCFPCASDLHARSTMMMFSKTVYWHRTKETKSGFNHLMYVLPLCSRLADFAAHRESYSYTRTHINYRDPAV